jgi:hypothetical protein
MSDWTIYNNESEWQDLSDERKGLLLLACHKSNGNTMLRVNEIGDSQEVNMVHWISCSVVYRAIKPEAQMWEMMRDDIHLSGTLNASLIAKKLTAMGWTKNDN